MAPLLEAMGIAKYFGAITALHDVNFHVDHGEVLGVVGDNGAGKSTLMKILSGLFAPSEGELLFDGKSVRFNSPKDARRLGIEMVYQDFALAGNMPIYENIYLGREPGRKFGPLTIVDHPRARQMAADHLERLHIQVKSVEQNTEDLSGGQRQAVAIARATAFQARLVIMDEPTAALAIKEVGKVLDLVRGLKQHGVAVIIISHRMDDIFYCCDRVMALYQGTNFAEAPLASTNRNEVIGWIMGHKGNTEALAHDRLNDRPAP
ncbi:MAG: ATP-binding cassette domain-containing protein [Thiobacillus sp.]|uniref:ATP-binding cassette domain-containing protein n=1 Tax=Thiobacillus sp. TaxID=924 RepID=UPI002894EFDD|nr:ATP-binding cassette domain-containing protein [Thiobacillus sp.]MDT3707292.1 ATP-binding cassette domain-containing protein [Thiobacillus sp.]